MIEQAVDHYDGFNTLLDFAGMTPDVQRHYPGQSYRAMLQGERPEWDETIYGEYGDLRMIRTPQWKLVLRYPDGPHDLFDLVNDPDEVRNLIDEPDMEPVIAELTSSAGRLLRTTRGSREVGAACEGAAPSQRRR